MPTEITDPDLLRQLEGGGQEVTDPAVLTQLNAPSIRYGSGRSFDTDVSGNLVPSGSEDTYSPIAGNSFLRNALIGSGKFFTDVGLGARQIYAQTLNPSALPALQQEAANKRQIDAPVMGTWGGRVGQIGTGVLTSVPLAAIPGLNASAIAGTAGARALALGGAAAVGGAYGALNPTTGDESRVLNTAIGAGLGVAAKYGGDKLAAWISNRAGQPFTGWRQATANNALADEIGADDLSPEGLRGVATRIKDVFGRARSPDVNLEVTGQTQAAIDTASGDLSESAKAALLGNKPVADLAALQPGSNVTAERLGGISSRLGAKAAAEMTSKTGDRELGAALFQIKNHVDDLIGGSITDPALKADYDAVRQMYPTWMAMKRGSLFNAASGNVNPRNFGTYLQKKDFAGYALGEDQSPLYQMARWGQETRMGNAPPVPVFQLGKWLRYHAANNPVIGAVGGATSRLSAPIAPYVLPGLPALGGTLIPNFTQ